MANIEPYQEYNASERFLIEALDTGRMIAGHEFHDPVCLIGYTHPGPGVLDLTGAIFHDTLDLQLTRWSKMVLDNAQFRKGMSLRMSSIQQLSARGVRINGYADFMDVKKTTVSDFTGARLPSMTWTDRSPAIEDKVKDLLPKRLTPYGSNRGTH